VSLEEFRKSVYCQIWCTYDWTITKCVCIEDIICFLFFPPNCSAFANCWTVSKMFNLIDFLRFFHFAQCCILSGWLVTILSVNKNFLSVSYRCMCVVHFCMMRLSRCKQVIHWTNHYYSHFAVVELLQQSGFIPAALILRRQRARETKFGHFLDSSKDKCLNLFTENHNQREKQKMKTKNIKMSRLFDMVSFHQQCLSKKMRQIHFRLGLHPGTQELTMLPQFR